MKASKQWDTGQQCQESSTTPACAAALGGTRTQELLVTKYWAMDMGNRDRGGRCARVCVIKEGQKIFVKNE